MLYEVITRSVARLPPTAPAAADPRPGRPARIPEDARQLRVADDALRLLADALRRAISRAVQQ